MSTVFNPVLAGLDQPGSLLGVSGGIRTPSVKKQQIYSLLRLSSFAALTGG